MEWRRLGAALAIAASTNGGVANGTENTTGIYVRLETGAAWQARNDVQIPNDETATRFSLSELTGSGPAAFGRLSVGWRWSSRQEIWALVAPLTIEETATPAVPIDFAGTRFAAGEPVDADYQFNSWRAGYRYRLEPNRRWSNWVGFTAKIRDARVELRQGELRGKNTDVGFVPLLHLATSFALSDRWTLLAELDGLAGGPGRALDGSLQLHAHWGEGWFGGLGYRTLEGGADVDSVYNFAWLNYGLVSLGRAF